MELVDKQGWQQYWTQKNTGGMWYALVASFYRKFIIRPSLNHFLDKYIPRGATLLHAGCGTGQVDADLHAKFSVIALDISPEALNLYRRFNGPSVKTVPGDILNLPFEANSLDGIYNLGVMEHFEMGDIDRILAEFHRVLVPTGKVILFWPPEYGLSVRFFKVLVRIFRWFGKEAKFHPDEISRLQSKQEANAILTRANFTVQEYAFGRRDLWTYAVVVAEKTA